MESLNEFLVWLYAGGGSIVAISWLFERMKWFHDLTSEAREIVMFVASAVVGVLAFAVTQYVSPEVLSAIAPYFAIVSSVFGVVFLGKAFHKVDKK